MPIYRKEPSTIYAIRCKTTGKIYIGSTTSLELRIAEHFKALSRGEKLRTVFTPKGQNNKRVKSEWQNDYDRYGKDDFEVYRLEDNVNPEERLKREDYWMKKYKANNPKYGYNKYPAAKRVEPRKTEILDSLPPLPKDE